MLKKGLTEECADQIGEYVRLSGGIELCDKLLQVKGLPHFSFLFFCSETYRPLSKTKNFQQTQAQRPAWKI